MDLSELGLEPHHSKTMKPGDRFGRLVIVATGKPPGSYRYQAVCRCDCGTFPYVARADSLAMGAVTGCGCVRIDSITTHGLSNSPLFDVWKNMLDRCENPHNKSYANYGGRGIRVCERWHRVEDFIADMEPTYQPGLTLDRKDNSGDYEPANCRWATKTQQSQNRRSCHAIRHKGRVQSLHEWASETGIPYGTLWSRIFDKGWTVTRALTTPSLDAAQRMKIARTARWGS